MKIDAFTHVRPQVYVEWAQALLGDAYRGGAYGRPEFWDIDASADGKGNARETIASIQALPIPPAQKEQILGGNLHQLLGL